MNRSVLRLWLDFLRSDIAGHFDRFLLQKVCSCSMVETNVETEDYKITREKRESGSYEYEFVLYLDAGLEGGGKEELISASRVESIGGFGFEDIDNWTSVLETFAEGYLNDLTVDAGMEAVRDEYDL